MTALKRNHLNKQNKSTPKEINSNALQEMLQRLISDCNLSRLNKSLRTILLNYIAAYKDTLPLDFDVQLYDFQLLLNY